MFIVMGVYLVNTLSCNAQVPGCIDPLANNYDPDATVNDGSCTYDPFSLSPKHTYILGDQIQETSGLILWDGKLWTHNDNADTTLYQFDTGTADIERTYPLAGVNNVDWEEISQDQEYIYLGDFGNNTSGNRDDLHILRINKISLIAGNPNIDTIWFSYSDQIDFTAREANSTDFDCEAMIVMNDSIYLFTKQWISAQTSVYRLPKIPGTHIALKKVTYNVQGLVTGATYLESKRIIVLCGYTSLLHPFLFLLYDFAGRDFFSGNKRRITVSLPFHQIEGIASSNGIKYYLTNEKFVLQPVANNLQKLHLFDLGQLLEAYLLRSSSMIQIGSDNLFELSPNPTDDKIIVRSISPIRPMTYQIYDQKTTKVLEGILTNQITVIDISHLTCGVYLFLLNGQKKRAQLFIKY